MIKDSLTPELKSAFVESIDKTKATHREHGFFMCLEKDGKLFPSEYKCEGTMHVYPQKSKKIRVLRKFKVPFMLILKD